MKLVLLNKIAPTEADINWLSLAKGMRINFRGKARVHISARACNGNPYVKIREKRKKISEECSLDLNCKFMSNKPASFPNDAFSILKQYLEFNQILFA